GAELLHILCRRVREVRATSGGGRKQLLSVQPAAFDTFPLRRLLCAGPLADPRQVHARSGCRTDFACTPRKGGNAEQSARRGVRASMRTRWADAAPVDAVVARRSG